MCVLCPGISYCTINPLIRLLTLNRQLARQTVLDGRVVCVQWDK